MSKFNRGLLMIAGMLFLGSCATSPFYGVPEEERYFRDVENHSQSRSVAFQRTLDWVERDAGYIQKWLISADPEVGTVEVSGVHFIDQKNTPSGVEFLFTITLRNEFAQFDYSINGFLRPTADQITKFDMEELEDQYEVMKEAILDAIDGASFD